MYPIAISTAGAPVTEAMLTACREAGITHMELSYSRQTYDTMELADTVASVTAHGLTVCSLHLPFSRELDISLTDPDANAAVMAYQKDLMTKTAAWGIPTFVIHPSSEPISEEERPARMARAKESLSELAELADSLGVTLAVEDLPRTCLGNCSAEMLELLSAHSSLRSCFDTNHLLGEDTVTYIRNVGKRIITTHVSDYDFVNERHWLPGEGKQDFSAILAALGEVGYRGPWLYELGLSTPKSIIRPRELTYADFGENARALFAGKKPAAMGTPVAGLGMWA